MMATLTSVGSYGHWPLALVVVPSTSGAFFCDLGDLCGNCFRKHCHNGIQQVVDAAGMLGGNWEHLLNAKAVEIINQRGLFLAIDLVDGDKERPVGLPKQAHQFEIGPGEFRSSVDDHDDGRGLIQRHASLAVNF